MGKFASSFLKNRIYLVLGPVGQMKEAAKMIELAFCKNCDGHFCAFLFQIFDDRLSCKKQTSGHPCKQLIATQSWVLLSNDLQWSQ